MRLNRNTAARRHADDEGVVFALWLRVRGLWRDNPLPWIPREWIVLWLDDDAYWPPNTFAQVKAILRNCPQVDMVAGYFGTRLPFATPLAFRDKNDSNSFPKVNVDCQMGDLVEVERVSFHFVAHRVSVLEKVGQNPFTLPEEGTIGEDFAFCDRARAAGCRIVCATGLPIAHIDPRDGAAYIPGMPALRVEQGQLVMPRQHVGANGEVKIGEARSYGPEVDAVVDAVMKASA